MAEAAAQILLVEDSPAMARVYREFLSVDGHAVVEAASVAAALAALAERTPDAIVLDLQLPDASGLEVLKHVRTAGLVTAAVVVTANGSINAAVEAMREGAFDFIVKPVNAERLIYTVRNALERHRLRRIVQTFQQIERTEFCGFIGRSLPMQAVYRTIESAANSKASIFVTGESGTGKEVCADAIHRTSNRAGHGFVALNCAAIPHELLESEIFGHVRGAFTGATADRTGAAARAHRGTLFLDEICEMPLDLQVKLLRFVQTGTYTPVGGQRTEEVDVRFVCATNRDPLREVQEGRFREDLFYRLHVIPIGLPPLRERGPDLLALARHFLGRWAAEEGRAFRGFDRAAERAVETYPWPGNVRQLQNVIRSVVVLNEGDTVTAAMLTAALQLQDLGAARQPLTSPHRPALPWPAADRSLALPAPSRPRSALPPVRPLAAVEREAIEAALALAGNNVARAAAMLEISPSTIYRKVARWDGAVPLLQAG
jgi:two-component system repressor protein LuxO